MNELSVDYINPDMDLRSKIHLYRKSMEDIEHSLDLKPYEWGRFQSRFNQELNSVFRDLMEYEKKCFAEGQEEKIYKLKNLFVRRVRKNFLRGSCIVWSLDKPYGYAGDHKIIDDIYRNEPKTTGVDRLYDNYFQMSSISVAVRNRKDDFKRNLIEFLKERKGKNPLRIMNLASGPCRDLAELYADPPCDLSNIAFECVDHDERALSYASNLLCGAPNVRFHRESAIRIALKRDVKMLFPETYDYIYCLGLFDYFDSRVSVRLVKNLRQLLKPGGVLAISNVYDKYSNPSIYFMEWVGDWNLVYRSQEDFENIFIEAGFSPKDLTIGYEQQGIMQYVFAVKKGS